MQFKNIEMKIFLSVSLHKNDINHFSCLETGTIRPLSSYTQAVSCAKP
jgi:hypothetical protein